MRVEEAYRKLWPIVRAKCARMMADDSEAEDVAQQAFERLWRSRLAETDPEVVSAWIYRTSTRLALDRLRRRRVRAAHQPEPAETPAPHERTSARHLLAKVALAVPKREFEVVVLHRVDGLTQPEVAEVLGISERTVRRLLSRFDERRFDGE